MLRMLKERRTVFMTVYVEATLILKRRPLPNDVRIFFKNIEMLASPVVGSYLRLRTSSTEISAINKFLVVGVDWCEEMDRYEVLVRQEFTERDQGWFHTIVRQIQENPDWEKPNQIIDNSKELTSPYYVLLIERTNPERREVQFFSAENDELAQQFKSDFKDDIDTGEYLFSAQLLKIMDDNFNVKTLGRFFDTMKINFAKMSNADAERSKS